jgi:carbamoyl-phosphate synthase large subunit
VIVQYGGQTPLKLALGLEAEGVPIIGTSPDMIDAAEDRERFQKLLHELGLRQPPNATARTEPKRWRRPQALGYPLVVRPSYVLGGRAMEIVHEQRDLERYMREAVKVSNDSPGAAGPLPERRDRVRRRLPARPRRPHLHRRRDGAHRAGRRALGRLRLLAAAVFAVARKPSTNEAPDRRHGQGAEGGRPDERAVRHPGKDGKDVIFVLEVNPRASRTVPYVSKATGIQLAKVAARCMVGQSLASQGITNEVTPPYFSVKEAVFPFVKFPGVDTILGPEMKSTGEVMGVGKTFGEAFVKSQLGAGTKLPTDGKPTARCS